MGLMQWLRVATLFPCHAVIGYMLSEHKYGKKVSMRVWVGYVIGCAILVFLFGISLEEDEKELHKWLYILTLIPYVVLFMFTSSENIWKNLFLVITYAVFYMSINPILVGWLDAPLGKSDGKLIAARSIFYLPVVLVLKRWVIPALRAVSNEIRKGWGMLAAVALLYLLFVSMHGLQYSLLDERHTIFMAVDIQYLIMNLVLLAIITTSYGVILRLLISMSEEYKREQINARQKMLEAELYAEKEYIVQARRFHHDLRHHNRVLLEYLGEGRVEEAERYLTQYEEELLEDFTLREFCEHPVANALICMTERKCRKRGIDFKAQVQIPKYLPLEAPEAGMLFGNFLENAWESCEACIKENGDGEHKHYGKPKIEISAKVQKNVFCMEVKNTSVKSVQFADGLPRTTREKDGGIGSRSIGMVLQRYKGMVQYDVDGGLFITQIVLPVTEPG